MIACQLLGCTSPRPTDTGRALAPALDGVGRPPIAAIEHPGIIIQDLTLGSGRVVGRRDIITVDTVGRFPSDAEHARAGQVFYSTIDPVVPETDDPPAPLVIGLDRLITGWQAGLRGMRVGGERILYIPWVYAYGSDGRPDDEAPDDPTRGIPPEADLIFTIKLLDVAPPAETAVATPASTDNTSDIDATDARSSRSNRSADD